MDETRARGRPFDERETSQGPPTDRKAIREPELEVSNDGCRFRVAQSASLHGPLVLIPAWQGQQTRLVTRLSFFGLVIEPECC